MPNNYLDIAYPGKAFIENYDPNLIIIGGIFFAAAIGSVIFFSFRSAKSAAAKII